MELTMEMNPAVNGRQQVYLGNFGMVAISDQVPAMLINGGWYTTWCPQCGIGKLCNFTCRGPLGFWVRLVPQASEDPSAPTSYLMQYMPNPSILWHYGSPMVSSSTPEQWMSPESSPSSGSPLFQQQRFMLPSAFGSSPLTFPHTNSGSDTENEVHLITMNEARAGPSRGGNQNQGQQELERRDQRQPNNRHKPPNNKRLFCGFCFRNGERRDFYRGHALRDASGVIKCPILLRYRCGICGATGEKAHTESYCPDIDAEEYRQKPNFQTQWAGRRNATGMIYRASVGSQSAPCSPKTRTPALQ